MNDPVDSSNNRQSSGGRPIAALVALVAVGLTLAAWQLSTPSAPSSPTPARPSSARTPVTTLTVKTLCSQCHKFPDPSILPKSEWPSRIGQMAKFKGYGSKIRGIVNTQEVIKWYVARAPEALDRPTLDDQITDAPQRFTVQAVACPEKTDDPIVISNVQLVDLLGQDRQGKKELLACDMSNGLILLSRATPKRIPDLTVIARIGHPARCQVVDLDNDGLRDLLVADLGSFGAFDHDLGKVTWLRQHPAGTFTPVDLAENLSRVAEARAADFDQDGDLDLVVGEFGWRTTGRVLILEHNGRPGPPTTQSYTLRALDQRHGTIHAPPIDLDGDGQLDFVTLIAQEHEAVVAFLGKGDLGFTAKTLYQAPHPCWGSSGMQLVDLDGDGDTDVLLTNGDTMDDAVLKPDHGVRWLENTGTLAFTEHHLARLYGVHRAEAADIDSDGDMDIIACGFVGALQGVSRSDLLKSLRVPSLLWIEQTSPGSFTPRTLEAHLCNHPTLSVGDIDGDGDIDIAVGNNTRSDSPSPVDVWINHLGDAK